MSTLTIEHIQFKRGSAAAWTSVNPILLAGEPGLETDSGKTKYGDGVTPWVSLPYSASSGGSSVNSVNGHFGTVVLTAADVGATTASAALTAAQSADTTAIAAHVAAADPHPVYLTAAEGNAAYDAIGAAGAMGTAVNANLAAAISAHTVATDPHGDRAYAVTLVDDLSGVTNPATARTNLGLGTAATTAASAYDASGAATAAQAAAIAASAQRASNLSDLASATTARTNLGLGTAATTAASAYATAAQGTTADNALAKASNLSDVANAGTARTNLGLTIGTNVQAWDADLDAVAALAATGVVARTGAGTVSARTITGTTNRVTVSNGDGVSGNPTLDVGSNVYVAAGTDVAVADGGTGSSTAAGGLANLGGLAIVETVTAGGNTGTAKTIPDVTTGTCNTYTLTGNCTFTMPTAAAGKSFTVLLTQDGTGGRTATFTGAKWAAGTAPTITSGAGKIDLISFACLDGTNWIGSALQDVR